MSYLSRVSGWLDRLVAVTMILLLAVMLAVTSAGVFWRYVLNSGLVWAEELSRLLLVWASFLGAASAVHRGAHISIAVLHDRLPPRARLWMTRVTDSLIIAFMGAIMWYGIKLLPVVHIRVAPTVSLTMDIPYLIIPVSAGIMIFQILVRMLTSADPPEEEP
ncbi:MAG: TRAP transporter small permease [Thermodesulfobacteriota bacterium]